MNVQKAPNGIEWTRVWGRPGYTWNPVGGCLHNCQWEMPDGTVAQCYAKTIAEKRFSRKAYGHGFEHHYYRPRKLNEPLNLKEPAGIFLDSMSDLMGHWVSEGEIQNVLATCDLASAHVFFLLTKNASRLKQFNFPPNVWTGVSSPPDWMWKDSEGQPKRLSRHQQERMLQTALRSLSEVDATVRWMSFEPLSWDCADIVAQYPGALQWAVIGAASNGRNEYPPRESDLLHLLEVLDKQNVPVFFKGNLKSLPYAAENWREEFPAQNERQIVSSVPFLNLQISPETTLAPTYVLADEWGNTDGLVLPLGEINGLETELATLRQQYADLCDEHATATEERNDLQYTLRVLKATLKPILEGFEHLQRHKAIKAKVWFGGKPVTYDQLQQIYELLNETGEQEAKQLQLFGEGEQ